MRMLKIAHAPHNGRPRRGLRGQRRRRSWRRQARKAAVAYLRSCLRRGGDLRRAAARLGVSPRTASRWNRAWRSDRLALRALGRPILTMSASARDAVIEVLQTRPGLGVPALRELFPDVGKRELQELVERYRRAVRRKRRVAIRALRWTRPGSVWAMDFSEPPCRIDGIYDQILCVRDLASSCELWALPILGKSAEVAIHSLKALVCWYGAPLVLKLDNDGVFRSDAFQRWAHEAGIRLLYSPPYTPKYNGAIETGMGSLKTLAHVVSATHDRPGEWTRDDVEEARCRMNLEGRPRGARGPSPNELWRERMRIAEPERARFNAVYQQRYVDECAARKLDPAVQWQHNERASIDRAALTSALVKLGLLWIRRRRITLPIRTLNRASIS